MSTGTLRNVQRPHRYQGFQRRRESIQQFDKFNDELYVVGWKSQFLSGLMMPLITFVGNLAYVGISILGGYLAVQGTIGVGDILASSSMSGHLQCRSRRWPTLLTCCNPQQRPPSVF